jgi:hypothetical protein
LKRPAGVSGNHHEILFGCVIAIDDQLEKFLVTMGETEDLRLDETLPTTMDH